MKKKKNETLKITWIMTAVYWVVGLLCMFWGKIDHAFANQVKDINNVYALTLLIISSFSCHHNQELAPIIFLWQVKESHYVAQPVKDGIRVVADRLRLNQPVDRWR